MEEALKKLDELALELKLLTTEMREKGPRMYWRVENKIEEIRTFLNTTAAKDHAMSKISDSIERVVKSTPVDKQTALAMSGGSTYSLPKEPEQKTYLVPIPLRPTIKDPSFTDLTGLVFGRLVVMGLAEKGVDGNKPRWACRCTCGKYSTHRAFALKNGDEDRCHQCNLGSKMIGGTYGRCRRCGWVTSRMPLCRTCGFLNTTAAQGD